MKYAKVLHDAWNLASANKKLVWFAFVPSFVTIIIFIAESLWQGFFMFEELGRIEHGTLFRGIGDILELVSKNHLWGWFIFLLFIIFLFAFVFPAWIQSTLVLSIRQNFVSPDKRLSLRQKTIEGSKYFFKLFEFHAIVSPFSFISITFYFLALYRYTHQNLAHPFFSVLIIFSIFAIFVNLFLAYTPYFIVCERENLSSSIKKSIGLVFLNIGKTIGLILIMFLVNLRVIINVLVVFGVPIGMIALASSYASSKWFAIIVILGISLGVLMLGLAAYLTAILEVFSLGFWERAFTKLREEQKKLEFDEEEVEEEIETITAERINNENSAKKSETINETVVNSPIQIAETTQKPYPNKPQTIEDEKTIHFKAE